MNSTSLTPLQLHFNPFITIGQSNLKVNKRSSVSFSNDRESI